MKIRHIHVSRQTPSSPNTCSVSNAIHRVVILHDRGDGSVETKHSKISSYRSPLKTSQLNVRWIGFDSLLWWRSDRSWSTRVTEQDFCQVPYRSPQLNKIVIADIQEGARQAGRRENPFGFPLWCRMLQRPCLTMSLRALCSPNSDLLASHLSLIGSQKKTEEQKRMRTAGWIRKHVDHVREEKLVRVCPWMVPWTHFLVVVLSTKFKIKVYEKPEWK